MRFQQPGSAQTISPAKDAVQHTLGAKGAMIDGNENLHDDVPYEFVRNRDNGNLNYSPLCGCGFELHQKGNKKL
jgi:hypothetical protein